MCSRLLQDVNRMAAADYSSRVIKQKEEAKSRIAADCQNRINIQKKLDTCIHSMKSDEDIVNMMTCLEGYALIR